MSVPVREVKDGWTVNPGTPDEWVVVGSGPVGALWDIQGRIGEHGHRPSMQVPPGQLVDAAPPGLMGEPGPIVHAPRPPMKVWWDCTNCGGRGFIVAEPRGSNPVPVTIWCPVCHGERGSWREAWREAT